MIHLHADALPPAAAVYLSRIAMNQTLWAAGLILECILAWIVIARRIARRFPAFAALMVFYPLRAGSLFAFKGHIDGGAYQSLGSILSLIEFVLQILVAGEIGFQWARALGGRTRQYGLLAAIAFGALALAWCVAALASGKVAIDRMEVFIWFLMAGLFPAVLRGARRANLVRISAGFAVFSIFQLVALCGRLHAWAERDVAEYLVWSYVPAAGYIAVVAFWLAALHPEPVASSSTKVLAL